MKNMEIIFQRISKMGVAAIWSLPSGTIWASTIRKTGEQEKTPKLEQLPILICKLNNAWGTRLW